MNIFDSFLRRHQQRIVGLDILRSIAILIVVYEHSFNFFPEPYQTLYYKINPFKIDGVSIFFVLSGFLIGGILLRIINKDDFNKKDLINFWIRRWFRTIPNYLIVLFTLLIIRFGIFGDLGDFNLAYLLFSQNLLSPHPGFFPEAWSLTIEEWFYLLFPLVCYVFHKKLKNKINSLLISAFLFLFIPLLLRIIKYECGIGILGFDLEFRKIVILRLDSIMYGIIAAYIQFKQPAFWLKYNYLFLAIGILLVVLLNLNPWSWKGSYLPLYFNIESITTFCFLPFLSVCKTTKWKLADTFFIFISIISYSMYLLNLSIVQVTLMPSINHLMERTHLTMEMEYVTNYFLYWFLTIFLSYLLYQFYEKPVTRLRDDIKVK